MPQAGTATFLEHIFELRRRIVFSLMFIGFGAGIGYLLYNKLLYILQLPYGQELYYTAPTGALSFLIRVCLTFGFIIGLPVLIYHLLTFIAPVVKIHTRKMIVVYSFASIALAITGISFAYFVSLPAALHFLVNFGNPESVQALITANEYFNFVLAYLAGFAVLFQIPLIMIGINRLTPQKPLKLLKSTKYVVLLSFIVAAILTPTPDPFNQTIMAGPMIVLYLLSVGFVAMLGLREKRRDIVLPMTESTKLQVNMIEPKRASVSNSEASQTRGSSFVVHPTVKPKLVSDIIRPALNSSVSAATRRTPPQHLVASNVKPLLQRKITMDIINT